MATYEICFVLSTRKTEPGPPLPFFPPLPFPPSRFLHCTVLYYVVLYCTVLYCTVLYSSPSLQSPSLQKLTCFESLTGGPRMHADILFSLLCGSLATPSTSLRSVVTQCRLHKKTKKRPGQLDTALTHRWRAQWHGVDMILFYLIEKDHGDCSFICPLRATVRGRWFIFHWSTQSFNQKLNGHYYFASPYRKEINLIQVKNRAWSPSLLRHVFYIVLKNSYKR